ncbi:MAG TPA: ABC transporter ATP-binding protein [Candidatus Paceibacterota bacterium]|nr:ABC transporter ATP-binding protein [Candidatus Paceibacterota bacterium]
MSEPIIRLENVNFWYERGKPNEYHALKDVSCDIYPGEYAAFFGSSGSGKTTLLYLISGIEPGQDGRIVINGRDISTFTRQELAIYRQIGVGMIFQQFNLIPSLTVVQNVILPMSFLGVSEDRSKREAMKLLERVNIAHLADRYPDELSGGQQQRVGIVRALANNPPIIIADEPLGNLDSSNADTVLQFLKELNEKDGRTIIMVTHEAWSLRDAKKIFYMKDGVVTKEDGVGEQAVQQALSKTMYGRLSPGMSEHQLAAHSFSNLFLRGYAAPELKRFEFFLAQRLDGKIDADVFRNVLDRPWREGGLGLWRQKAAKVSSIIEDVIAERRTVGDIYHQLETDREAPLKDDIEKLRRWLLEDYHGVLNSLQVMQLDEVLNERIRGVITPEHVSEILSLPRSRAGLGFATPTAHRICERLEFILKEGHPQLSSFAPTAPSHR